MDTLILANAMLFLSTLSLRRATTSVVSSAGTIGISIHALLAESDATKKSGRRHFVLISIHALLAESDGASPPPTSAAWYFYPRSPCGERRVLDVFRHLVSLISIHALLAESDPQRRAT